MCKAIKSLTVAEQATFRKQHEGMRWDQCRSVRLHGTALTGATTGLTIIEGLLSSLRIESVSDPKKPVDGSTVMPIRFHSGC